MAGTLLELPFERLSPPALDNFGNGNRPPFLPIVFTGGDREGDKESARQAVDELFREAGLDAGPADAIDPTAIIKLAELVIRDFGDTSPSV